MLMNKFEKEIISVLGNSKTGLTLSEVAEKVDQPEKKVFRTLKKLFSAGKVDSEKRRYKLVEI